MLCTQAELEIHMHADFGVEPEDAVTQLIESASALIENAAGRSLTPTATITGELHHGGEPSIWVRVPPIDTTSTVTVTEDSVALTENTDFLVTDSGRIVRLNGSTSQFRRWADGIQNIAVTYDGGPATVPDLARSICLDVVARAFKSAAAWANAPDVAAFAKRLKLDTDEAEFRAEALEVAEAAVKLSEAELGQVNGLRKAWFE